MKNKELKEMLKTSIDMISINESNVELTIVGGFAVDILFNNFYRTTFDIDVITNLKNVESYGLSSQANQVIERFPNYKKDRLLLKEFSTSEVSVYVVSVKTLLLSKTISGREVDLEDIKFIKEAIDD